MSVGGTAQGASLGMSLGGGYGAAAGAALGALGLFDSDEDNTQAKAFAAAQARLEALGTPPDLSREIVLQQFREAGQLSPQVEQRILQQSTAVSDIQEDQTGRDSQVEALNLLRQRGRGLGAEERSAFNEMRDMTQRDAEAKRMQVMQNMAARGQGGSGAELMAALQGAQSANTRLSQEGDRLGASASTNALSAISKAGQLGANLRSQDYSAEMDKAKALDAMQEFNLRNSQSVQQRNIAAVNQAQAQNLANKQRISDANIQMANAEKYRQSEEEGKMWDRGMQQALGVSNIGTQAARATQNAPSTMQQLGKVANTLGQAYKSDNNSTMGEDAFGALSKYFAKDKQETSVGDYKPMGSNIEIGG